MSGYDDCKNRSSSSSISNNNNNNNILDRSISEKSHHTLNTYTNQNHVSNDKLFRFRADYGN